MFADKFYLLLLLLLPVLAVFLHMSLYKRKADLASFISRIGFLPLTDINLRAYKIKNFLMLTALFFIIIALARPQFGSENKPVIKNSWEIIVALDVSKSMSAQDIEHGRLQKAKEIILKVIDDNPGGKIGIIAFAGTAVWQCPVTYDYQALKMFLHDVQTDILPVGGTQISSAVILALRAAKKDDSSKKTMILMSDGEDHDSNIKEAVKGAVKAGMRIITVGIGTPDGCPVPVIDENGNVKDYLKDSFGKIVISRVNTDLLKIIAAETGGKYFCVSGGDISGELSKAVRNLGRNKNGINLKNTKTDRFQVFLFIALILLFIELLFPLKKLKI